MLAFLIHQSLLRRSLQSWCLLPTCTSAYVCGACLPVCACAYVRVNRPTSSRRSRPSLEDSQFPHWLRLSPQTYILCFPSHRFLQCFSQALLILSSSRLSRFMTLIVAQTQCILSWLFPKIPPRLEHVPLPGSSIRSHGRVRSQQIIKNNCSGYSRAFSEGPWVLCPDRDPHNNPPGGAEQDRKCWPRVTDGKV